MQLGLIGLGRMGGNMAHRLVVAGHQVVGLDHHATNLAAATAVGVTGATTLADLVARLKTPRAVWLMVPHGKPTEDAIVGLLQLLAPGDLIVDGGNSHYVESIRIAAVCEQKKVGFIDAGVSGGVWGLKEGYCIMAGGTDQSIARLQPIFTALVQPGGFAHVGPVGAGHFVKMVHNAIEYGMLQAFGEGFECLERSDFKLDLEQVAEMWRHGSVVRSWLLDLLVLAFQHDGKHLDKIAPYLEDSGTGRWTVEYAVANAIPIPAITDSVYARFLTRDENHFSARVISALRNQFGGHAVKSADSSNPQSPDPAIPQSPDGTPRV